MANEIPGKVRSDVRERDQDRCIVCGAVGTQAMHRIPRRDGGHARSNLALGCDTCHRKAHADPAWGFATGITVSRYADPLETPIRSWRGWVLLDDVGTLTVIAPRTVTLRDLPAYLPFEVDPEG